MLFDFYTMKDPSNSLMHTHTHQKGEEKKATNRFGLCVCHFGFAQRENHFAILCKMNWNGTIIKMYCQLWNGKKKIRNMKKRNELKTKAEWLLNRKRKSLLKMILKNNFVSKWFCFFFGWCDTSHMIRHAVCYPLTIRWNAFCHNLLLNNLKQLPFLKLNFSICFSVKTNWIIQLHVSTAVFPTKYVVNLRHYNW